MSDTAAATRPRRMGWLETRLRVALYFAAYLPVFAGFEVVLRVWAMALTKGRDAEHVRRFNIASRAWGRSLVRLTWVLLRSRAVIRGTVPPGRYVVVCNHQSTADIPILFWALPSLDCKFVAKRSLGRFIPTVSTYLVHGGAALISRTGNRDDLRALAEMGRGLERWNGSAIIFAEATRSRDGSVGHFHAAAARIVARESGLPLLPLCIDGTHPASDLGRFAEGMIDARVTITIGTPVTAPEGGPDFGELMRRIEDWTADVIEANRREADGEKPPPGAP